MVHPICYIIDVGTEEYSAFFFSFQSTNQVMLYILHAYNCFDNIHPWNHEILLSLIKFGQKVRKQASKEASKQSKAFLFSGVLSDNSENRFFSDFKNRGKMWFSGAKSPKRNISLSDSSLVFLAILFSFSSC